MAARRCGRANLPSALLMTSESKAPSIGTLTTGNEPKDLPRLRDCNQGPKAEPHRRQASPIGEISQIYSRIYKLGREVLKSFLVSKRSSRVSCIGTLRCFD